MTRRDKNLTESGMKINECTSVWKENKEQQRQRIDLPLFPKEIHQKKKVLQQEMEAEL